MRWNEMKERKKQTKQNKNNEISYTIMNIVDSLKFQLASSCDWEWSEIIFQLCVWVFSTEH